MFGNIFGMMGNYENRKVGRDDFPWGFISTCSVTDGAHPYETAVEHTAYNDGKLVIVEAYDSKDDAELGHAKWVATMTAKKLPASLTDCANAEVSQMIVALGGDMKFKRGEKRKQKAKR